MSIPSWSAPGVTLEVRDGRQAAARETELVALHDEVAGQDDDADFARRLGVWVALSTQAGSSIDEDFPGLAALVDPHGTVVTALPDWHEGTLLVDLPD